MGASPDNPVSTIKTALPFALSENLSWFKLLSHWKKNPLLCARLFVNEKPLDVLVAGLKDNDTKEFIRFFFEALLKDSENEPDPSSFIDPYQALVKKYHIPDDILFGEEPLFINWLNTKANPTDDDETILLNNDNREVMFLDSLFPDKTDTIRYHFRSLNTLRLQFCPGGILRAWQDVLSRRLTDNQLDPTGFWYTLTKITRMPNHHIQTKTVFSYGDVIVSMEDRETNILQPLGIGDDKKNLFNQTMRAHFLLHLNTSEPLEESHFQDALNKMKLDKITLDESIKISKQYTALLEKHHISPKQCQVPDIDFGKDIDEQDTVHFRGSSEYELLPTEAGLKGRCVSATAIIYTPHLVSTLSSSSTLENLVANLKDIKKQEAVLSLSDPNKHPLQSKIAVLNAAMQYLINKMNAKELAAIIINNIDYGAGSISDKTIMLIEEIIKSSSFDLEAKLLILIAELNHIFLLTEQGDKQTLVTQKINVLQSLQDYLNEGLNEEGFNLCLTENPLYTEGQYGMRTKTLVDEIMLFKKPKTTPITTISEKVQDNTTTPLPPLDEQLALKIINVEATLSKIISADDKKPFQEQIELLNMGLSYLNGEIIKKPFEEALNKQTVLQTPDAKETQSLLTQVKKEKLAFLIKQLNIQMTASNISEDEIALLTAAINYLSEAITPSEFRHISVSISNITEEVSNLLTEVLDEKPINLSDG
jgi:hypothetical protein